MVHSSRVQNPQTFLTAAPGADPASLDFEPSSHLHLLETALKNDERISQWLPRLVPKRVSEQEFWNHYYSHVNAITQGQPVYATAEEAATAPTPQAEIISVEDENLPAVAYEEKKIDVEPVIDALDETENRTSPSPVVKFKTLEQILQELAAENQSLWAFEEKYILLILLYRWF